MQDYDASLYCCVVHDGVVGFSSDAKSSKILREAHSNRVIVAQIGRLAIEKEVAVTLEVVASRVGGIPEGVLDNQTGLLIEWGEVIGFCAAIEKMCNEPELRARR